MRPALNPAKTMCDTIFEFHPHSDPTKSIEDGYFALSSSLSAYSHKFRRYILENRYLRAHRSDKDEESHYTIIRMPQEFELALEPVLEFMHSGVLKFQDKDVQEVLKLLLYFETSIEKTQLKEIAALAKLKLYYSILSI